MPPSALAKLSSLHIEYPMLFSLTNHASGIVTHGGVLEFIAEEGRIYIPPWMMQTLRITEGGYMLLTKHHQRQINVASARQVRQDSASIG
jgi:ubiquitin fusion degradation protein 1